MADHFFVVSGGNTSDAASWSATSGGAGGFGVPTSSDNIFFDQGINSVIDALLQCNDCSYTTVNSCSVNANIEVNGKYLHNNGNWIGIGIVKCFGDVEITNTFFQAFIEFLGDDTTLKIGTTCRMKLPTINKNVGKKLTLIQDGICTSFSSDWVIEEGILDLGAFNLTGNDVFTMNGGAVTSTTGILTQAKYFLNDGVFDPFKAISKTSSNSTLFTDSATVSLMPSGGDFEFNGSNHWTINQNFTEFPHVIIGKCPTCTQSGQFYAKDVTINNDSRFGNCFIRGDLLSVGVTTPIPSGAQTFDGVGDQSVTGFTVFGRVIINKISGSLVFNDDFKVSGFEVIAGASLVDFGTTLCDINFLGHLFSADWIVAGLEFGSIELNISASGQAQMNNTVCKYDFTVTRCGSLSGDLVVGGNLTLNDTSINSTFTLKLNGASDQEVFVAGTSNDGMNRLWEIDKPSGVVKLQSDVISTDPLSFLHLINGIICTNGFDITTEDLTLEIGTAIQKVSPTVVTVNGTTTNNGSIVDVQGCNTGITV